MVLLVCELRRREEMLAVVGERHGVKKRRTGHETFGPAPSLGPVDAWWSREEPGEGWQREGVVDGGEIERRRMMMRRRYGRLTGRWMEAPADAAGWLGGKDSGY